MKFIEEKLWTKKVRLEIINELNDYLQLYLFKGNISQINTGIENIFNLSPEELFALKSSHFILSKEVKELIEDLPFLLRNLSHSTQKEKIEYNGLIRGKIDWNSTFKSRYSQGFNNPSLFVCNPPSKSYDLAENQLLKFLLKKIVYLFENSLSFIRNENIQNKNGLENITIRNENIQNKNRLENITIRNENIQNKEEWQDMVNFRYFTVKKALKNVYFEGISDINKIKPKDYRKTINHRNSLYKKLAIAYKLYENLFVYGDLAILKDLIQNQILKPSSDDTLFELFVFFSLANYLPKDSKLSLGLLMPKNDYSIIYDYGDGTKVKIYYQGVPAIFNQNTKYKRIFDNYNINVNIRRPDILLEFEKDGEISYRIVEVKRTSSDSYLRDSVYKVLGYLEDFKGINFTEDTSGVIVCWEGIAIENKEKAFNQDVLVLNKDDFLANLSELFKV